MYASGIARFFQKAVDGSEKNSFCRQMALK